MDSVSVEVGRSNPNLAHALYDFESKLGLPEVKNCPPMPPVKPAKDEVGKKFDVSTLKPSCPVSVGKKFDQDKPDWSLLPMHLLTGIVKVLTFGAKKYARNNWMHVPDAKNRYTAALLRHLSEWQSGNRFDAETGLSHLHHIGCCLLFLIWFEEKECENTSR